MWSPLRAAPRTEAARDMTDWTRQTRSNPCVNVDPAALPSAPAEQSRQNSRAQPRSQGSPGSQSNGKCYRR